jgi:type VI secretion system secreted protein VgrG
MASFQSALAWTLNFEDPRHEYAKVPDDPPGAFAIAGVNSAAWPKDFATINALGPDYRPAAVAQFYDEEFWNQWLAQIVSDEVAKRVFDAGVNMGKTTAARLFQEAVNEALTDPPRDPEATPLAVDGQLGPASVAAANACNPTVLVQWFESLRSDHYEEIAAANPSMEKYLAGWLARAQA